MALQLLAYEEDARSLGCAEPFVAVRRQEVDVHGLYVDREDAQGLDRIHAEQDIARVEETPDRVQIARRTRPVVKRRKRHEPSAVVDVGMQRGG